MISKNKKFGISDVTLIELGEGDVIVCDLETNAGWTGVGFTQDSFGEIGRTHPERDGKDQYENKYDVVISCTKTESFNVLINALRRAKRKLEKKKRVSQNED